MGENSQSCPVCRTGIIVDGSSDYIILHHTRMVHIVLYKNSPATTSTHYDDEAARLVTVISTPMTQRKEVPENDH